MIDIATGWVKAGGANVSDGEGITGTGADGLEENQSGYDWVMSPYYARNPFLQLYFCNEI